MTEAAVTAFLAHVLAAHLSVPEPVSFRLAPTWPFENCAHVERLESGWRITYDSACWSAYPKQRAEVLAHELCHAALDTRDEKRTKDCARQVIRSHKSCGRGE